MRVRRLRESLGMTQEELAERTGLSRNQIQNIEANRNNHRDPETGARGVGNPRLETVFLLAHHLQVEMGDLVGPDPGEATPAAEGVVRR